ncbi:MAG: alpha-amylase family protein [Micrococcales bacterium]
MGANVDHIKASRTQMIGLIGESSRPALDLLDRFDRWAGDLVEGLAGAYDLDRILPALMTVLAKNHLERDPLLHQRDRERVLQPDWFQSQNTVGYVCYTDLFAQNLQGLQTRIPYLKDLGITYLHLMPILKPRPGANDGGYAVMDYRSLREDLGTMKELRDTAGKLHSSNISLTLDLVLNHVALEHEWAIKAKSGDQKYRDFFYIYPDREIPDRFEQTLPEVFPDFAPGNFTWDDELNGWVWTTFNSYQWDVNWSNPDVFCEFADIIANLANHGVDCLRLDAIAFIWKRMGTNCQSQPEVHAITQALRAFARIFSPSLIFKAEAIVGPAEVGAYLGEGNRAGKVSDLAYHNSLMVQIWSSIASKDARLMELALSRFQALPNNTAWGIYLRCHDDIGWAIDDGDANRLGFSGHEHRMFLADYFTGKFYGSDARGVDFQVEEHSGERRTSGSAASLAGIEACLESGDTVRLQRAIDRYLCAYAMVFGFGGIPLIYMGDEIGLVNDATYLEDPAKAEDNRWIHRPGMNWHLAEDAASGKLGHSVAGQLRAGMAKLVSTRKRLPALHAGVATRVRAGNGTGIAIFERRHPAGILVQVYNLAESNRFVNTDELAGLTGLVTDELSGNTIELGNGIQLAPYEVRWLTKQ